MILQMIQHDFKHVVFPKTTGLGTCDTCSSLKRLIHDPLTPESDQEAYREQYMQHISMVYTLRKQYYER